MSAGSEPDQLLEIYDNDVEDDGSVIPFSTLAEQGITDQTPLNDSTVQLSQVTVPRDDSAGIRFEAGAQFTEETIAMAQLASLAYYHDDSNEADHMRRTIEPYPQVIKVGRTDSGLWSDPHQRWVDTGAVPFRNIAAPAGLMVYEPLTRDPNSVLVPVCFVYKGTSTLWEAVLDVQLNQSTNQTVPQYEAKLQEYVDFIENYLTTTDTSRNWRVIGHSLGAKYALDSAYLMLRNSKGSIAQRCTGCYCFNPFFPADIRYREIYGATSSKRTLDESGAVQTLRQQLRAVIQVHVIQGDFSSQNVIRRPFGNVTVYPSVPGEDQDIITDESWRQLSLVQYLTNKQHSILNFAAELPEVMYTAFPGFNDGDELAFTTVTKEMLGQFSGLPSGEYPLSLFRHDQHIIDTTNGQRRRFVNSIDAASLDPQRYHWTGVTGDYAKMTTLRIGGKMYMNFALDVHSRDATSDSSSGNAFTVRVIPTLVDDEYLLEEVTNTFSETRLLTAPGTVWENSRMPMELQQTDMVQIGSGLTPAYTAAHMMIYGKSRWKIGTFSDPGHRRNLSVDPLTALQLNDGTEFVIKSTSSTLANWYLEVGPLQDASQTGFLSLMMKSSNAQTSNSTGIKWTVLYEHQTQPVALDTYTFTNVADPTVVLGVTNVYRVGGSDVRSKDFMTDGKYGKMQLSGTAGSDVFVIQNETYQLQTTEWNLYGVHTNGVYETLPMTFYETVQNMADTSTYQFQIRPYDATVDDPVGGVVPISSVPM